MGRQAPAVIHTGVACVRVAPVGRWSIGSRDRLEASQGEGKAAAVQEHPSPLQQLPADGTTTSHK